MTSCYNLTSSKKSLLQYCKGISGGGNLLDEWKGKVIMYDIHIYGNLS